MDGQLEICNAMVVSVINRNNMNASLLKELKRITT